MVLGSSDKNRVTLVAKDILMQQHAEMNLFDITKYNLVNMTYPEKGVKMVIKFRRKIMSEMMTTYLPSILLMMITFATTLFKPFFFEAALSVNLTTMLVMTNIFISKMEGLPPTSDIKMIDIWLILCQLVPFTQVVLLTVMEYLREEPANALEKDAQPKPAKDERHGEVEANNDPKEAWAISQFQSSKASSLAMLMIIGKVLNIFYALQEYLFREESDATRRALCLHCLLFNCCKFLLHVTLCWLLEVSMCPLD